MAAKYTGQVTFMYDDDSTRNYNFDEMTVEAVGNFKGRIFEFNEKLADSEQNAAYRETFISEDGAPVKKIQKAKYTSIEEQVIYSD